MNTITGTDCSVESMFAVIGGWNVQFTINGKQVGGTNPGLLEDPRLLWHMENIGGVKFKRILELGPMEAAHTKTMLDHGAGRIIGIEGLSDCFIKCLIVKEAFNMVNARFIFGDFCQYVAEYKGEKFDLVTALGVLYHQVNPAKLIHDLGLITDTVIVWSQVADSVHPSNIEKNVEAYGKTYQGKTMFWGDLRLRSEVYCASLHEEALWLYPDEMRRCFRDAGFNSLIEKPCDPTLNGPCVLFVAKK